jgi:hypothetical protein
MRSMSVVNCALDTGLYAFDVSCQLCARYRTICVRCHLLLRRSNKSFLQVLFLIRPTLGPSSAYSRPTHTAYSAPIRPTHTVYSRPTFRPCGLAALRPMWLLVNCIIYTTKRCNLFVGVPPLTGCFFHEYIDVSEWSFSYSWFFERGY